VSAAVDASAGFRGRPARFIGARAGQLVGLLFLFGPVADLAQGSRSGPRTAAIAVVLAAFVAVYLAVLPPVPAIARRGPPAIHVSLAVLAAAAGLTLALGAPASFVLLFAYVVAGAGLLTAPRVAAAVTLATALAVGAGLLAAGVGGAAAAAYALTMLMAGAITAAYGNAVRANLRLREAREAVARAAASEERLRIARDLHDLLGHTLSVIALKSELASRLVAGDPARARAEMDEVQEVTRRALTEVREAVQGYRQLGVADALDGARAALSAAGIDCRVRSRAAGLPAEVETVLAWAVREATTNVVRHSGARTCEIAVSADDERVALEVRDDGAGGAGEGDRGAGLAGLAERARRLDGRLDAGARPEGGYRLRVSLPLRAS
jgi:two-component system sensor histidine kinase DesK